MILPRRKFLTGLASLIAAPAVVRAASLMPVKALQPFTWQGVDIAFDEAVHPQVWEYRMLYPVDGSITRVHVYCREVFAAEESWQRDLHDIVSAQ